MKNEFEVQDILDHVENSCSQLLSKEELELVQDWFKIASYKAALLDLVLSGQIEIIGISDREPIVRANYDRLV